MLKLAHISDLHFFHFGKTPLQFFDKTFIGNWHYLLNRRHRHSGALAYEVIEHFKKEGVTHLLITGDYTNSSSKKEMSLMKHYLATLKEAGFHLYSLPGNHDVYTKRAQRSQRFYTYAKEFIDFQGSLPYNLIDHKVAGYPLIGRWWLLLIDCALPNSWNKATGLFSEKGEHYLKEALNALPRDALIAVASHFPFESFKYPYAHLKRGERLATLLHEENRIRLYLHGHRHLPRIEFEKEILLGESGSLTLKASSSFNLLEFEADHCLLTQYQFNKDKWEKTDVQKSTHRLV